MKRDNIELKVIQYYAQRKMDVFNYAPGLNEKNFKRLVFPQLEDYDTMGLRHIFRMVTTEETIHEYPQDWWNMFKAKWFPIWLIRYFPVKNRTVVAKHMFPYLQKELGKEVVKVITR